MQRIYLNMLVIIIFLPTISWAACTGSSPIWTTTADYSSVKECLNKASAGDTIKVSSTSSQINWNSTLRITKGIHLIGAGKDVTKIGCGGTSLLFDIHPSKPEDNPEIEIAGFSFDTNNRCTIIQLWDTDTSTNYGYTAKMNKANIHDNKFFGTTSLDNEAHYINVYGMGGVAWKNEFTGSGLLFRTMGSNENESAAQNPFIYFSNTLGTADAFVYEDNIFNITNTSDYYIHDCEYSGIRNTWRYNSINVNQTSFGSGWIDWHGYEAENYQSCMGFVMYGNEWKLNNNGSISISKARGGKGLIAFNDVITGRGGGSSPGATSYYGCPPKDFFDHNNLQHYNWSNFENQTTQFQYDMSYDRGGYSGNANCDSISNYPAQNWNWFDYETGFDGTIGVGCGTLAKRPTRCTERTAYFATNQGNCEDVSGYVGDIVRNPSRSTISGTLYVCGDNNDWSILWTPLEYPHPLREKNANANPIPPQNLRIVE